MAVMKSWISGRLLVNFTSRWRSFKCLLLLYWVKRINIYIYIYINGRLCKLLVNISGNILVWKAKHLKLFFLKHETFTRLMFSPSKFLSKWIRNRRFTHVCFEMHIFFISLKYEIILQFVKKWIFISKHTDIKCVTFKLCVEIHSFFKFFCNVHDYFYGSTSSNQGDRRQCKLEKMFMVTKSISMF